MSMASCQTMELVPSSPLCPECFRLTHGDASWTFILTEAGRFGERHSILEPHSSVFVAPTTGRSDRAAGASPFPAIEFPLTEPHFSTWGPKIGITSPSSAPEACDRDITYSLSGLLIFQSSSCAAASWKTPRVARGRMHEASFIAMLSPGLRLEL